MEDLLLTVTEHKLLRKHRRNLENRHDVKIIMPEFDVSWTSRDVIFATVCGEAENIDHVKEFLKMKEMKRAEEITIVCEGSVDAVKAGVPIITLSDSEQELAVLSENQNKKRKKKKKKRNAVLAQIDLTSPVVKRENACEVSSTTKELALKKAKLDPLSGPAGDCISQSTKDGQNDPKCQTSSTVDFIPLSANNQAEDIVLLEPKEEGSNPKPKDPKLLRPIVIDGSNVAREHGKKNNTFSCRGIQICVEYFLKKGHTQVTSFVPNYRRHCQFGPVLTTDQPILEELAKSQHVVFTPSRRVQGKRVTCYDDRFIVELASQTNGVIVSNDNYKDLIGVSDQFKKTIEERLLMFCFVDDILLLPHDPLGRNGPCLDDYLSFPEEEKSS